MDPQEEYEWLQNKQQHMIDIPTQGSETSNIIAVNDVSGLVAISLGNDVLLIPSIQLNEYLQTQNAPNLGRFPVAGDMPVQNLALSENGELLAVSSGSKITLLSTRKLIQSEPNSVVSEIDYEPLRYIGPYTDAFVAVSTSGSLLTISPSGQVVDLASNIRCVKAIGAKIYACSTTDISVFENGSQCGQASFSEEIRPYVLEKLSEDWWALLGYMQGETHISFFQSDITSDIDLDDNMQGGNEWEPFETVEGFADIEINGWMHWIPKRELLMFGHNYHHYIEAAYQENGGWELYEPDNNDFKARTPLSADKKETYVRGAALLQAKVYEDAKFHVDYKDIHEDIPHPPVLLIATSDGKLLSTLPCDLRIDFIDGQFVPDEFPNWIELSSTTGSQPPAPVEETKEKPSSGAGSMFSSLSQSPPKVTTGLSGLVAPQAGVEKPPPFGSPAPAANTVFQPTGQSTLFTPQSDTKPLADILKPVAQTGAANPIQTPVANPILNTTANPLFKSSQVPNSLFAATNPASNSLLNKPEEVKPSPSVFSSPAGSLFSKPEEVKQSPVGFPVSGSPSVNKPEEVKQSPIGIPTTGSSLFSPDKAKIPGNVGNLLSTPTSQPGIANTPASSLFSPVQASPSPAAKPTISPPRQTSPTPPVQTSIKPVEPPTIPNMSTLDEANKQLQTQAKHLEISMQTQLDNLTKYVSNINSILPILPDVSKHQSRINGLIKLIKDSETNLLVQKEEEFNCLLAEISSTRQDVKLAEEESARLLEREEKKAKFSINDTTFSSDPQILAQFKDTSTSYFTMIKKSETLSRLVTNISAKIDNLKSKVTLPEFQNPKHLSGKIPITQLMKNRRRNLGSTLDTEATCEFLNKELGELKTRVDKLEQIPAKKKSTSAARKFRFEDALNMETPKNMPKKVSVDDPEESRIILENVLKRHPRDFLTPSKIETVWKKAVTIQLETSSSQAPVIQPITSLVTTSKPVMKPMFAAPQIQKPKFTLDIISKLKEEQAKIVESAPKEEQSPDIDQLAEMPRLESIATSMPSDREEEKKSPPKQGTFGSVTTAPGPPEAAKAATPTATTPSTTAPKAQSATAAANPTSQTTPTTVKPEEAKEATGLSAGFVSAPKAAGPTIGMPAANAAITPQPQATQLNTLPTFGQSSFGNTAIQFNTGASANTGILGSATQNPTSFASMSTAAGNTGFLQNTGAQPSSGGLQPGFPSQPSGGFPTAGLNQPQSGGFNTQPQAITFAAAAPNTGFGAAAAPGTGFPGAGGFSGAGITQAAPATGAFSSFNQPRK